MKILVLSCHSVLEYDLLRLLTEIPSLINPGFDVEVFSMGAYSNPTQSGDYMRSTIPMGRFYPHLHQVAMQCDKDRIHPELVDWCDVILSMHNSKVPGTEAQQPWIVNNWPLFEEKEKKVIWYTIGQSVPAIEREMKEYKRRGLRIVRYCPLEKDIPDYAGEDALIRFYKDEAEFHGWTGERKQIITAVQSFKRRGEHVGYPLYDQVTDGFPRKVFGTENEDLGAIYGGLRSYEELKRDMREARCYWYYGTHPAPYTLSFIEAFMTGCPIIAPGPKLRSSHHFPWNDWEIPDIITNGVNGYVANSIDELRGYIQTLLDDPALAKNISERARKTAIDLFGYKSIAQQWADFLRTLTH